VTTNTQGRRTPPPALETTMGSSSDVGAAAGPNPFCHMPHYVTGTYDKDRKPTFLDDSEYGRVGALFPAS
jgi:hypothetical protein